jgi:hypothetical protein
LKFLASNLNTVLPIIIIFHFDLFDGPFRPFDGPLRPFSMFFDRIRPFSSWAGNKQKWGKYLNHYNSEKHTTPVAPTTTMGAKLRKTKCEE